MGLVKLSDTPSLGGAAIDVATRVGAVEEALAGLAGDLAPEHVPGHALEGVMAVLGKIERRAGGMRLVLAKAAADLGAWKAAGARSPEEHLAKQGGISLGEARADLQASERLACLPAARAAAVGGTLSKDASRAIAQGAIADPATELALLDTASRRDLAAVRDHARRVCHRVDQDSGVVARRRYRRRGLRAWVEVDGEGRGAWNVPPEYQAAWLAALEPYRQEAFRLARESGQRPGSEALMADAMQMLCLDVLADHDLDGSGSVGGARLPAGAGTTGADRSNADRFAATSGARPSERRFAERQRGGGNRRAPAQVVVHASYEALIRGHTVEGETCEVPGLGPVPVAFARRLAGDALLKTVLTKGADVAVVTSHRRYVPTALRQALEGRDRRCVVPGCAARHHLQIHHWRIDFARDGPTELANLARVCRYHHDLVSYCGWTLDGGPGHWTFHPP